MRVKSGTKHGKTEKVKNEGTFLRRGKAIEDGAFN